jgi:copper chaperone NosL
MKAKGSDHVMDISMKPRSIYRSVILLSFILQTSVALLLGCKATRTGPPELVADKIACNKCNMLLSETRFAAAFEDKDGNAQVFDDIGCMLGVLRSLPKLPEHIWVRDYRQDLWIEANTATFVSSQKLGTPMNYGFVALANAQDADELARANDGKVLAGFDTLMKEFRGIS